MGTGLKVKPTGTHIAFSAGTGNLVFLDLAAECLLKVTGQAKDSYLKEGFQFIFYIYAASRDHVAGLELLERLDALDTPYFKLHLILTRDKTMQSEKLDSQQKIVKKMESHGKDSKVWVCGPPIMNELFEKALDMEPKLKGADINIF